MRKKNSLYSYDENNNLILITGINFFKAFLIILQIIFISGFFISSFNLIFILSALILLIATILAPIYAIKIFPFLFRTKLIISNEQLLQCNRKGKIKRTFLFAEHKIKYVKLNLNLFEALKVEGANIVFGSLCVFKNKGDKEEYYIEYNLNKKQNDEIEKYLKKSITVNKKF